jgi:hypothetical protein
MSGHPMTDPNPIRATQEGATLRLAWDNRTAPKDRVVLVFLVGFWLLWAPTTVAVTVALAHGVNPCFFSVWLVFGWGGTIAIPLALVRRRWSEWVEVSAAGIVLGSAGWLAPRPKVYPAAVIRELALYWYHNGSDHESMPNLCVIEEGGFGAFRSRFFGYWLAPRVKSQVFEALRAFIARHHLPIKVATYGDYPGDRHTT